MYRNPVQYCDRIPSIFIAGMLSGPLFVLMVVLAECYTRLPAAIPVEANAVVGLILAMPFASVLGSIIALPINAIATGIMVMMARNFGWARLRLSWAMAGALIGASPLLFPDLSIEGPVAFALIATSALCGWLCSRHARWSAEDEAEPGRPVILRP